MSAVCFCASVTTLVTSVQAPRWFVPLVDGTRRCPIGGDDQREWPPAKLCMVGVVVFNPQAPKSHFLPFLGQDGTKLEFYFIIRLHIGPNFNTYSCLHRWNAPLSVNFQVDEWLTPFNQSHRKGEQSTDQFERFWSKLDGIMCNVKRLTLHKKSL